ncbi:MAG: TonB-dependent receptor plug domain-containing protein [Fluviicola sp.]
MSTLLLVFLCVSAVSAQEEYGDSTMQIKRFSFEDLSSEKFEKYKTSSSTNRLAENPDDLTQEVIIIDGDEIRKFGHTTLVDVLKTIPGFRTSQPGNSIEGETFLMRGLLGNDHTKILINGIPIKPEGVKSMPISAQLPIRHAEYIEIVQGPSSATYGSDAMAGVINIVLPEVDRSVFAWADVSGVTPATTDINLTLGGKAGKGKNILNYQIFASSQSASTVNLLINRDSVLIDKATLSPWQQANYLSDKDDQAIPEVNSLGRASRLIGGNFKFRGFELFATNMYREDHAAFGFHPLARSYSDPSTKMGETINSVGLRYFYDNRRRFSSRASISGLYYQTIEDANYVAISDRLAAGRNFIFGRSLDLRADYQGIMRFNDQFKIAFGSTAQYSVSNPYTSHLARRVHLESNSFDLTGKDLNPFTTAEESDQVDSLSAIGDTNWIPKHEVVNVAFFTHFLYKTKGGKLNIESAARIDLNTIDGIRFTPQLGVVYRPTEKLKLVLNYGRGHRAPRSYHIYNNYWQPFSEIQAQNPMSQEEFFNATELERVRDTISTELLEGGEVRFVWRAHPNLRISGRYYAHLMQNRITRQANINPPPQGQPVPPNLLIGYGYANNKTPDTYSFLQSGMITIEYIKNWKELSFRAMGAYQLASGYEEIEQEEDDPGGSVERSADYRFVPLHSIKANVNLSFKGFTFSIHNNVFGYFTSDIYIQGRVIQYQEFQGWNHNLDILVHKDLFRQLSLFVGAYNVLNSFQSGITASSLSNSWNYNPQYGRVFKFGLNFRLN